MLVQITPPRASAGEFLDERKSPRRNPRVLLIVLLLYCNGCYWAEVSLGKSAICKAPITDYKCVNILIITIKISITVYR